MRRPSHARSYEGKNEYDYRLIEQAEKGDPLRDRPDTDRARGRAVRAAAVHPRRVPARL